MRPNCFASREHDLRALAFKARIYSQPQRESLRQARAIAAWCISNIQVGTGLAEGSCLTGPMQCVKSVDLRIVEYE